MAGPVAALYYMHKANIKRTTEFKMSCEKLIGLN